MNVVSPKKQKHALIKRGYVLLQLGLNILLLTVSISCRERSSEWQGSIAKQNGITIIRNAGAPIYKKDILNLKEEMALGGKEPDKSSSFLSVRSIDIDGNGNVYVLDADSGEVRVFDYNGHFLMNIGARGQGPGELQRPQFIQVNDREYELIIWDLSVFRFLYYSLDGKYLRQLSAARLGRPLSPIRWDSMGDLITFIIPAPVEGGIELAILNDKLELIKTISKVEKDDSYLRRESMIMHPDLYCAVDGNDNLIWGNSRKYELHVLNNKGKHIKTILLNSRPQKIGWNDKRQLEDRFSRSSAAKFGYKPLFPKYFPFFQKIAVDDEGRIFILTYEKSFGPGGYNLYDIFDSEGRYLAKVSLNIRAITLIWKRGKLYTIETDEDGFYYVKRYSIIWKLE